MDESPFKGRTGFTRLLNALRYSVNGFGSAFRHEEAFRQEALLAAVPLEVPPSLVAGLSQPPMSSVGLTVV